MNNALALWAAGSTLLAKQPRLAPVAGSSCLRTGAKRACIALNGGTRRASLTDIRRVISRDNVAPKRISALNNICMLALRDILSIHGYARAAVQGRTRRCCLRRKLSRQEQART